MAESAISILKTIYAKKMSSYKTQLGQFRLSENKVDTVRREKCFLNCDILKLIIL